MKTEDLLFEVYQLLDRYFSEKTDPNIGRPAEPIPAVAVSVAPAYLKFPDVPLDKLKGRATKSKALWCRNYLDKKLIVNQWVDIDVMPIIELGYDPSESFQRLKKLAAHTVHNSSRYIPEYKLRTKGENVNNSVIKVMVVKEGIPKFPSPRGD